MVKTKLIKQYFHCSPDDFSLGGRPEFFPAGKTLIEMPFSCSPETLSAHSRADSAVVD